MANLPSAQGARGELCCVFAITELRSQLIGTAMILVIEGSEQLRILRDVTEDLHDTVFLELTSGTSLDLESVSFFDGTEQQEPRVEFHFPREVEGRATIDPESERIVFHCEASAKMPRLGHDNTLALRAEFRPRAMRVHGVPDL